MSSYKVSLIVNVENGDQETNVRDVEASDAKSAKMIILNAWLNFLYLETDTHKIVKNSGIKLEDQQHLDRGSN
jgi:hypothetical protein